MEKTGEVRIDTSLIPDAVRDELARVVLEKVRKYFANITPEQQAKFEKWKAEYHRKRREEAQGGKT